MHSDLTKNHINEFQQAPAGAPHLSVNTAHITITTHKQMTVVPMDVIPAYVAPL